MTCAEERFQSINQPTTNNNAVILGRSVSFRGHLVVDQDLRIDGQVEGKVELGNHDLVIGPHGRVNADIIARNVSVSGDVVGDIAASGRLQVSASGSVAGHVRSPRISLAGGAQVQGRVDMPRGPVPRVAERIRPALASRRREASRPSTAGCPTSFASKAQRELKRWTFHGVLVPCSLVFFLTLGSLLGAVSLLDLGRLADRFWKFEQRGWQVERLEAENHAYRELLSQVGAKVSSLELLADKVVKVASPRHKISPNRARPVGRYLEELRTFPNLFNSNGLSAKVDGRFDDLAEKFVKGYWKLTYTPSIWPVDGYLSGRFGLRPRTSQGLPPSFHHGVDIVGQKGKPVRAAADGNVIYSGRRSAYGKTVVVKHEFGISSLYAHLSALNVRAGEPVRRGQLIGRIGSTGRSTGPHLHYEIRIGNISVNPVHYLPRQMARNRLQLRP